MLLNGNGLHARVRATCVLVFAAAAFLANGASATELMVAVKAAMVRERADGYAPAVRVLSFGAKVTVGDEVRMAPALTGAGKYGARSLPTWVYVESGDVKGYLPVGVLVNAASLKSAAADSAALKGGSDKAVRGFSESEDDFGLASMKGAAGKVKLGEGKNGDVSALDAVGATVGTAPMTAFLKEGKLSVQPFSSEKVVPSEGAVSKLARASALSEGDLAKLNKLMELTKNNTNEEIRLAVKALQVMALQAENTVDPIREHVLGRLVAERFLASRKALPMNDPRSVLVDKVGKALAAASNAPEAFNSYHFVVVESPDLNACATSAGYVFVNTGLLDFIRDEEELAVVLAHEIAHVELHHGVQSVGIDMLFQLFSLATDYAVKDIPDSDGSFRKTLNMVVNVMSESMIDGYGAEVEGQADWRGIQLAMRLGYDGRAMTGFLTRLKEKTGSVGGNGYPRLRVEDAEAYFRQMGGGAAKGRDVRANRYKVAVGR